MSFAWDASTHPLHKRDCVEEMRGQFGHKRPLTHSPQRRRRSLPISCVPHVILVWDRVWGGGWFCCVCQVCFPPNLGFIAKFMLPNLFFVCPPHYFPLYSSAPPLLRLPDTTPLSCAWGFLTPLQPNVWVLMSTPPPLLLPPCQVRPPFPVGLPQPTRAERVGPHVCRVGRRRTCCRADRASPPGWRQRGDNSSERGG